MKLGQKLDWIKNTEELNRNMWSWGALSCSFFSTLETFWQKEHIRKTYHIIDMFFLNPPATKEKRKLNSRKKWAEITLIYRNTFTWEDLNPGVSWFQSRNRFNNLRFGVFSYSNSQIGSSASHRQNLSLKPEPWGILVCLCVKLYSLFFDQIGFSNSEEL